MGRKLAIPAKLPKTELQISALKKYASRHSTPHQMSKRANILLHAFEGQPHSKISKELKVSVNTVKAWRKNWNKAYDELSKPETQKDLTKALHLFFKDLKRSGKPNKFTEVQTKQIVALACDKPTRHEIEMTDWTNEMLALTAQSRGIVESISASQVRRILKKGALTTA
jgi:transposase